MLVLIMCDYHVTRYATVKVRGALVGALAAGCWGEFGS